MEGFTVKDLKRKCLDQILSFEHGSLLNVDKETTDRLAQEQGLVKIRRKINPKVSQSGN